MNATEIVTPARTLGAMIPVKTTEDPELEEEVVVGVGEYVELRVEVVERDVYET